MAARRCCWSAALPQLSQIHTGSVDAVELKRAVVPRQRRAGVLPPDPSHYSSATTAAMDAALPYIYCPLKAEHLAIWRRVAGRHASIRIRRPFATAAALQIIQ